MKVEVGAATMGYLAERELSRMEGNMDTQFGEFEIQYTDQTPYHVDSMAPLDVVNPDFELSGLEMGNKIVVVRPRGMNAKKCHHELLEYLTNGRCDFSDKTVILDLTDFKTVPLSVMGWIFLWRERLERNNASLVLTGVAPRTFSPALKARVFKHFEVRRKKAFNPLEIHPEWP